jgi:hypothetical protein
MVDWLEEGINLGGGVGEGRAFAFFQKMSASGR